MATVRQKQREIPIWDRLGNNEKFVALVFILPSLIGFIFFYAVPAIRALVISFHEWNLLSDAKFVGLDNYQEIFEDDRFWRSLRITIEYVLWNIPIQTALAIFMAVMLDKFSVALSTAMRSVMILPWLMPNVIVALLWLWILDPSIGIANVMLNAVNVPESEFLGSPDNAIRWIAGINIWRHAGYNAILIFAA